MTLWQDARALNTIANGLMMVALACLMATAVWWLAHRQVFELQAIEGLPTRDVCLRLGISEANCWVRLHRARRRLSEQLAAHY